MDLRKVSHFLRKIRGVPYCGAVIVAAGNASRMEGIDKILAPLEGIPVIQRTRPRPFRTVPLSGRSSSSPGRTASCR